MENNEYAAIRDVYRALDLKFGQNIVLLDIRGLTAMADFFVIATGGSAIQIQALASAAEETLLKHGLKLSHTEGMRSANWALMDFGDIIVHLFDKENRVFYNLERVWSDAKTVEAV